MSRVYIFSNIKPDYPSNPSTRQPLQSKFSSVHYISNFAVNVSYFGSIGMAALVQIARSRIRRPLLIKTIIIMIYNKAYSTVLAFSGIWKPETCIPISIFQYSN